MTLNEAIQLRTAVFNQYLAITTTGIESYDVNQRQASLIKAADLFKQLNSLDLMVERLSGRGTGLAEFHIGG